MAPTLCSTILQAVATTRQFVRSWNSRQFFAIRDQNNLILAYNCSFKCFSAERVLAQTIKAKGSEPRVPARSYVDRSILEMVSFVGLQLTYTSVNRRNREDAFGWSLQLYKWPKKSVIRRLFYWGHFLRTEPSQPLTPPGCSRIVFAKVFRLGFRLFFGSPETIY